MKNQKTNLISLALLQSQQTSYLTQHGCVSDHIKRRTPECSSFDGQSIELLLSEKLGIILS